MTSLDRLATLTLERIKQLTQEQQQHFEEKLNDLIESDNEMIAWQQLQAESHAAGRLTLEAAQWLYQRLGGEVPTRERWRKLPLGEKVIVSKLMEELTRERFSGTPGPHLPTRSRSA